MRPNLTISARSCEFRASDSGSVCGAALAYVGRGRPPRWCGDHRGLARRVSNRWNKRVSRWLHDRVLPIARALPIGFFAKLEEQALLWPCTHAGTGKVQSQLRDRLLMGRSPISREQHVLATAEFVSHLCEGCFSQFSAAIVNAQGKAPGGLAAATDSAYGCPSRVPRTSRACGPEPQDRRSQTPRFPRVRCE